MAVRYRNHGQRDRPMVACQCPLAMSARVSIIYADVNPADYAPVDADAIVWRVLDSPQFGPGSIVDLHGGSGPKITRRAWRGPCR